MTDQLFLFRCKDVRKHACEYRRGELHAAELRKFEEHLANCEACQNHVDRLENMLDAAAIYDFGAGLNRDAIFAAVTEAMRVDAAQAPSGEVDAAASAPEATRGGPGQTVPLDRDALFARVSKEIAADLDAASAPPPVRLQIPAPHDGAAPSTEEHDSPRSAAPWVVVALAAGILIGFMLPALFRADPNERNSGKLADNAPPPALEGPTPAPEPERALLADLALQPAPAGFEDVRIFGSPTADWTIRTQGKHRKLKLESGSVLVEFVPVDGTSLEFTSDEFTVRVTGTIFYASADPALVGVVTGSVEIDTPEGRTVALTDGEEWSADDGVHRADAHARADAARFVDPVGHRDSLARARKTKPRPAQRRPRPPKRVEAPRPPLSEAVVSTPTRSLRAEADEALREGRFDEAAQYYERMVEEFSAADPANASLRLDLARIYIQHLGRAARAVTHLRHFVEDRPADPATPSARAELCRIVADMGERDALCDPP